MQAGETGRLGEESFSPLEFSINPERVAPILRRLISPTKTRARIYGGDGGMMGGSSLEAVHSLANVLVVCGDGVRACHGYVESHRAVAYRRGALVPRGLEPASHPLVLHGGSRKLLDPVVPLYVDDGWALDAPAWPTAA